MKRLIIFLLLIIIAIFGFSKYQEYVRYHSEEVKYTSENTIDLNYYNQETVFKYHEAIENLNSFVMLQWTANDIDVRTPEDDDTETKAAVSQYSKKLAIVKFYENILLNSKKLKDQGFDNKQIESIEKQGIAIETYQKRKLNQKIKNLFSQNIKLYNGTKNAIVYEVQKELSKRGINLAIDGVYRIETLNAIKQFEAQNNLLADGLLDELTLEIMFP